ncbi:MULTISPECIES: hypothetical protein [unclassified Microcoleus]|uniref:hypothetical protein n=1 Tax=unclassified Microcoleus TaxID=2642155 RepID=UPI002FD468EA
MKFAGQYSQWSDLRHLGVMCWMMVGLIVEGKVVSNAFNTDAASIIGVIKINSFSGIDFTLTDPQINTSLLDLALNREVLINDPEMRQYTDFAVAS